MSSRRVDKKVVHGPESMIIESTLPPTSSLQLLEGEGASVLVYSHDAALARVIRGVAADRYPIRIINEWNDLLQQIGSGKGRIVLLDVDALSDDVEEALAEVNRCADWLVMVIAAKQQQAQDFMRFWSEWKIHRLLIKPAAAGITRLLLESAFARFIELRELHENTDSMEIPHELVAAEEAKQRRSMWPVIGGALVVLGGAAAYFSGLLTFTQTNDGPNEAVATPDARPADPSEQRLTGNGSTDSAAPAIDRFGAAPAQTPAQQADPFEDELLMALSAESRGNLVEPVGDNALDYYAEILAAESDHVLALAGRDALIEDQFAIAQKQILEHDFDAAEVTLGHISRAQPPGARLQFMREQLIQLRAADAALEVARQASVDPPQVVQPAVTASPSEPSELQSILTLTRLRLDEGLLIEPVGDSARDYLMRALDLGAGEAELQAFAQQFSTRAVDAIPQALAAGNISAASAMLSTARELGALAPELVGFESEVAAALLDQEREANDAMHSLALLRIADRVYFGREDSAIALLNQLREHGAEDELIADVEARLTNAMSRSTREAISASRWNEADALLAAFETAALELPVTRSLERDLTIARRQAQFLTETAPVGEMTLLEGAPAAYPRAAQAAEVTGWVDLQFTVDTSGATTDIEVVGSEPEGQFENAAVTALTRYRFAPFEFEGRLYERRVRLRMRFELD